MFKRKWQPVSLWYLSNVSLQHTHFQHTSKLVSRNVGRRWWCFFVNVPKELNGHLIAWVQIQPLSVLSNRKKWIFIDFRLNSLWEKMITAVKWVMIWKADDDQDDCLFPFLFLSQKQSKSSDSDSELLLARLRTNRVLFCGDSWFVSWSETMNCTLDWKKEDEERKRKKKKGKFGNELWSIEEEEKGVEEEEKKKWKEWWKMKIGRKPVMNERWSGCNSCECSNEWKIWNRLSLIPLSIFVSMRLHFLTFLKEMIPFHESGTNESCNIWMIRT